jgi:hypothetical protein
MSRPGCLLNFVPLWLVALSPVVVTAQVQSAEKGAGVGTATELFRLFGMDDDFFKKFRDAELWDDDEDDPLARVLVRLAQVKLADLARWTVRDFNASDIVSQPRKFSGQILRLEGRVRRVTRIKPSVAQVDRYDLEKYYRCEMNLKNDAGDVVLFANHVPEHWKLDAPTSEPASAAALFLKRGPDDKSRRRALYFAADRVAWHPDTLLGNLKMDYGLFDTVRHERAITDSERECFFQLLAAAGRSPSEEMVAPAGDVVDATSRLVALMAKPEAHEGELHSFRGVARRAVKIHVNDPSTIRRFGFDHYFELVVFVELDGYQKIAGKKVSNHPVVFCVRQLPSEMPTGENIAEMVRASGFMFKKWRYTTQLTGEKGGGVNVASPLLIGNSAVWERQEDAQRGFEPVVGGAVIGVLACIGLFAWWYSRSERRIHNAVLAGRRTVSDRASLDNLEIDSIDAATGADHD